MRSMFSSHGAVPRAVMAAVANRSGAASVWAICWTIGFLMIGGLSVDVTNAFAYKSRLQSVADAAALAAALNIDDTEIARAAAVDIVERNLPPARHGAVLASADVEFGVWDPDTDTFTATNDTPDAVHVALGRTLGRGNAVPTWLLRLAGKDEWEVGAQSVSTVRRDSTGGGGGGGEGPNCSGVTIVSTGYIQTGGGNFFGSGVCIHADTGIATGGGDCFEIGAHLSTPPGVGVTINGEASMCANAKGTVQEPEIVVEAEHPTPIMDRIENGMFQDVWAALMYSYLNDKRKWYGYDKRPGAASPENGGVTLPDFLLGESGYASIVYVSTGWWSISKLNLPGGIKLSPLSENTIYIAEGGVQFGGGMDAEKIAVIAKGQIQTAGGQGLQFDHVYFFGKGDLNFAGNITWGDAEDYCADGIFRTYVLSESSLSFGGFGPDAGAHGVLGAAPRLGLGGAMKSAGGLYLETTDGYTSLGGGMTLRSCTGPLASAFADLDAITGATQPGEGGTGYTEANDITHANEHGAGNNGGGNGNGNGSGTDTASAGTAVGADLVR